MPSRPLDAGALVGALADDDRRRVFAAVELGAGTLDDVVHRTGLSVAAASTALGRLVSMGLVVEGDGALVVLGAAFEQAARVSLTRPRSTEHDGLPAVQRAVMDAFVAGGRIVRAPAGAGKRQVLLDWLAQDFEPGRRYRERQVNAILGRRHDDTATWRRYLVDAGFLDRADGWYWRAGGSVPSGGPATGGEGAAGW